MARTVRRKNYEQEHPSGSWTATKVAGYYTQYDYIDHLLVYRPPTKEEYWHDWKRNHCESRSGRFGPTKKCKRFENSTDRMQYSMQYSRWLKNPEHEIVDQRIATSAKWAWF